MGIRQQLAAVAASVLTIAAVPAQAQTNAGNDTSVSSTEITNSTSDVGPNNTNNGLLICSDLHVSASPYYACSEREAPFYNDPETRNLSIEQIGYIALERVAEAQAGYDQGLLSKDSLTLLVEAARKEFQRIAVSRKVEAPAWQLRHMVPAFKEQTPQQRLEAFKSQFCDHANNNGVCPPDADPNPVPSDKDPEGVTGPHEPQASIPVTGEEPRPSDETPPGINGPREPEFTL